MTRPTRRASIFPKTISKLHNRLIDGRKYFDGTQPEFEDINSAFKIATQAMEGR